MSTSRLPPITAALVIEITGLQVARDANGMPWCRDDGIGALRNRLGAVPLRRPSATLSEGVDETRARDEARVLLSEVCRRCKHEDCSMKDL